MKKISIVTPCYNEEDNVEKLYNEVKAIFAEKLGGYDYEHLFIDNCSKDKTVEILKKLASEDKRVKIIVNSRNFGYLRSPYYGILQSSGDATIIISADLQDPPELIPEFIQKWESGNQVVVGVKTKSKENPLMFLIRRIYYKFVRIISEVELIENYMGYGLYDQKIVQLLREIKDPYPYLRGIICELGFNRDYVEYTQPRRERGVTSGNFYTLYDVAMLGITSNSKLPLRMATMLGFLISGMSLFVALVYLVLKLIFWYEFKLGMAPLIIGLFFFSSVQLFFIGIIGEYIATINTKITNRPLVIEKERINFDDNN